MTPAERQLKQTIDKLLRANKDVTKALDAQAQLTASILETMTKLLNQRK
jgi:hypothetical protein